MARCRIYEQGFLDQAARSAGLARSGFQEAAKERLALGEQAFGDQALHRPLPELVQEIREEALDVGTWSVLMAQAERLDAMPIEKRAEVVVLLQEIAKYGAMATYLTSLVGELVDV